MGKCERFLVSRFLFVMCFAVSAKCNSSSVAWYSESTLLFDITSTVAAYSIPASTPAAIPRTSSYSSLLSSSSGTSSSSFLPSPTPDTTESMEKSAVVMAFPDTNLVEWEQIRNVVLNIIADESTSQCASIEVDCGTMNNVNYTTDDVKILPGYPKVEDGKLLVAFSVQLPSEDDSNQDSFLTQDTLLHIAATASQAIASQTGVDVNVGRYTAPSSKSSKANLALILPLTLIPAAIVLSIAAGFGSYYMWRMAKKHKSLNLANSQPKTEEVELMAYKETSDQ